MLFNIFTFGGVKISPTVVFKKRFQILTDGGG